MKLCKQCLLEKDVSNFYKHPKMSDGLLAICKECHKENVRENRRKNIEHYRKFDKERAMLPHRVLARAEYAKTPAGILTKKKSIEKYKEKNPVRRKVHITTGNAIRRGILVKMPCEVCGETNVHAHHDDYSLPLSVRWLCPRHHKEWHDHNDPVNG